MPTFDSQPLLFGLDLRAIGQDAAGVARQWRQRPPLSWLSPSVRVRLLGPAGRSSTWVADHRGLCELPDAGASGQAFVAVEIPEEWLLRGRLTVPRDAADQVAAAVRLEVLRLSPFAEAETAWGFAMRRTLGPADMLEVDLVMAARSHVGACLIERADELKGREPEAWALVPGASRAIVLRGFGEQARENHVRRGFGWSVLALVLALGWGAALALTPSLQLRERALDAQAKFTDIVQASRSAVAERERLLKHNEQLAAIDELLAQRADPKLALELLSKSLDDGTFLQRLDVKGRNVSMAGQTGNTTALVQFLAGLPGLEDVRSTTAAARQGSGAERFGIDFVLKVPPPPAPTPPAPVAPSEGAAPPTAASAPAPEVKR